MNTWSSFGTLLNGLSTMVESRDAKTAGSPPSYNRQPWTQQPPQWTKSTKHVFEREMST